MEFDTTPVEQILVDSKFQRAKANNLINQLLEAPGDVAQMTVSALMWSERADDPIAEGYDFHEKTIEVPTG